MSVLEIMERLLKLEHAVIHLEKKIQDRDKSCILLEFWIRQKFDYDAQAVSELMEEEMKRNSNETSLNDSGNNNNTAQEKDNQGTRSGYENLLSVLQAPSKSQQQTFESLNHLRAFSFTTNLNDDNRSSTNNNNTNVVENEGNSMDPFDSGGDNFPLSMEQDYNCDELGFDSKGTKHIDIYDYDESSHGTNVSTSTLATTNNTNISNNNFSSDKIDFGSYFEAESRRGNNSTATPSKTRTRKTKNDHSSGVNCKYCKKDFAKTYIFRHQKKCKWKTAAVASPSKEDLVQQSIESVSQPPEDQKTDPFISAVVMCPGGGENIVSDCGNTNSSASTPVMPMDENSADEEKSTSSVTEPKLRFSCKVCSQSFLTLRACRQHIVTEHITHVLNTPLIPSDAAFRIMENNNINGGGGLPTTSSSALNFNTNLAGPIQNLTNLTLLGLSSSSPGNVMTMSSPILQGELRGGGGGGGGTSKSKSNSNTTKDIILKQLFQHPVLRANNSMSRDKKQQGKSRGSSTPTSTITTSTNLSSSENDGVTTNQNQNLSSTSSNNNNNNNNSNSNQQNNQSKSQGFTYPCLHCKNVNVSKNFQSLQDLHLHVLQSHVVKKVKFRCPLCYQEFAEQDVFAEHIIKVHRQGLPLLQNENASTSSFDESRLNQSFSLPIFNIRSGDSNQSLNLSAIINAANNLQQSQSLVGDFQSDNVSNGQSQSLTQTQVQQQQQPLFKCGACSFTFQEFSAAEEHARECHTPSHFLSQELVESRALESSPVNHSNSSSNSNTDNQSAAIDLIRSTFGDNIFMCPGP